MFLVGAVSFEVWPEAPSETKGVVVELETGGEGIPASGPSAALAATDAGDLLASAPVSTGGAPSPGKPAGIGGGLTGLGEPTAPGTPGPGGGGTGGGGGGDGAPADDGGAPPITPPEDDGDDGYGDDVPEDGKPRPPAPDYGPQPGRERVSGSGDGRSGGQGNGRRSGRSASKDDDEDDSYESQSQPQTSDDSSRSSGRSRGRSRG